MIFSVGAVTLTESLSRASQRERLSLQNDASGVAARKGNDKTGRLRTTGPIAPSEGFSF